MSESDSENDYESADDDNDDSQKSELCHSDDKELHKEVETTSRLQLSDSKKAILVDGCTKKAVPSTVSRSPEPSLQNSNVATEVDGENTSKKFGGENTSKKFDGENTSKKFDGENTSKKFDGKTNDVPEKLLQNFESVEKSSVDLIVEPGKKTANVNVETSSVSGTVTQSDSSSDMQPKRVTLRLEKKIQEKKAATAEAVLANSEFLNSEKTSSWGSWGSSLLSTAASSVSIFTNQVSQGIGTVLETVETSLGAPAPEDLASILREKQEGGKGAEETNKTLLKDNDAESDDIPPTSSLFTSVTSLTKAIENTGGKVLMGGLDALEMIGKKTIDILTEGDPGLRNKRSAFSKDITLSQLLREAKERVEEEQSDPSAESQEENVHFTTFFDEFQGLVHLEALEMLSSQSQNKVQGILMMQSGDSDLKKTIDSIRVICEDLPSLDEISTDDIDGAKGQEFEASLKEHLTNLQLQIDVQKIIKTQSTIHDWLNNCSKDQDAGIVKNPKEVYRHAICGLAEFTAQCVEQFHKSGELILVQLESDFDAQTSATQLTGLTAVLCAEVGTISNRYCQCLNTAADDSENPDLVTPLITTVYLESSNSTTYIQDAFQLLVPVLQASLL